MLISGEMLLPHDCSDDCTGALLLLPPPPPPTTTNFPQTAYFGFTCVLQLEWQYLSRTVPGFEAHLGTIGEAIRDIFIPALPDCSPEEVRGNSNFCQLLLHACK